MQQVYYKKGLIKNKIIVPQINIQKNYRKKYLNILSEHNQSEKDKLLKNLVSEVELMLEKG